MRLTTRVRAVRALLIIIATAALTQVDLQGAAAQPRQERTPQTDRTVPVTKGTRLTILNDAGEVIVKTWDRDAVHVKATHAARVTVDVQTTANVVSIRSRGTGGTAAVDYEITVPAWLPVRISGQFLYIGIEGAQNEVSAETVRGDIVIRGGSGSVTAKSIQGEIIVEDAKGRITASSVNESIRITGTSGDITAETTNGDIVVSKAEARLLELQTLNGDVRYDGSIPAGAQYRFATHNGDITLTIPESTSATFTVRTFNGDFQSSFPTKAVGEVRRGRRTTYVLGGGGAEVELESFGGDVRVRRPGAGPTRGKERDKDDESSHAAPDKSDHDPQRHASGTRLSGNEQPTD
jgi:Putative adhesin